MSAPEEALEQVADVIETAGEAVAEQAEGVAEVVRSLNAIKIQFALLGGLIGTAMGSLVAYKMAYSKASLKFEKIAEEEISQMREHYREKTVAAANQEKPDLGAVVVDLGYKQRDYPPERPPSMGSPVKGESGMGPDSSSTHAVYGSDARSNTVDSVRITVEPTDSPEVLEQVAKENNIFRGLSVDSWNYDREHAHRTAEHPYVIHKEEFAQGNFHGEEYEKAMVTYFIQDDVLADVRDQRMSDIDETVGLANLERFGHGSEDANVVYVRNDRLKLDFEILRSGGSYTAEVLGIDEEPEDELRHSDMRRRRPQFDDD